MELKNILKEVDEIINKVCAEYDCWDCPMAKKIKIGYDELSVCEVFIKLHIIQG